MSSRSTMSIFLAAVEQHRPEEWPKFLDSACNGDCELREEVEKLLHGHRQLGAFQEGERIQQPQATLPFSETPVGTPIGPYKIREQIGEGGMGEVFVAEQTEPVRRKVALKIIKPGMATKEVIARFEAERQALAMMEHPSIARIMDGGTTDAGQPFFVMELVRGIPITEYCDQHSLSTGERLELFLQVCRAVQHAHQKGIIHRDLKPSNVLVSELDGRAVPKVIDFGVAKALGEKLTEQTIYTQFTRMVGTPLYMSPEQAGMGAVDIDTRSDVYSLGVLLYELLRGNTPFDRELLKKADFDEMRRIIREDDPARPSAALSTLRADALSTVADCRRSEPRRLCDTLKGELDWIVMKALDKDRGRRYESASALAADIERYLSGEAVLACSPSLGYRVGKLARRNKAAIATATVILAVLPLAIAGTSWQAWRATRAMARADQERQRALANFRRARDTVDAYLAKVDADELLQTPDMHPLRRELVEVARDYYQQFVDQASNVPELQKDLAAAYVRLAEIASILGQEEEVLEAQQKAEAIWKQLSAANFDDTDLQHKMAEAFLKLSTREGIAGGTSARRPSKAHLQRPGNSR